MHKLMAEIFINYIKWLVIKTTYGAWHLKTIFDDIFVVLRQILPDNREKAQAGFILLGHY